MKRIIFILFFILFFLKTNSQIITGTVYDRNDNKPIIHASIYFNGTMVGTNTDKNGFFKLDVSKYPAMPLSISALGYDQVTLTGISLKEPVVIYMTPKVFELRDVIVSDKSLVKARKANLKLFRSCFLGKTSNGLLSNILNEENIHFNYDVSDTLKAYTSEPLMIENRGLGYIVTFFLDEFEYDRKNDSWFFLGNILFNDDLNIDESLRQRYEKRRRTSFMGSKMQFFRALWNNELDSIGYQVTNTNGKSLKYEDIVIEGDANIKYLGYPETLFIYYKNSPTGSRLDFKSDQVYFDKSGFFDALNVIWSGQMAKQLIGDWLPYEYSLPDK